jgi:ubiquinone/menaquinone biosynthesis C-methylase UbiE
VERSLFEHLCCPHDHSDVDEAGDALECRKCGRRYPIVDDVVCFVAPEQLTELERREQKSRDEGSSSYDTMFEGYTNAVEVPTVIRRIGKPSGLIVDIGAGTGRITEALVKLGQPIIALDYSLDSLRKLVKRCDSGSVLAVQGDLRTVPVKDAAAHAVTSIEVHAHVRGREGRRQELTEIARVIRPDGVLSISAFNYNVVFRLWKLIGNEGAKEGDRLLDSDMYYLRMTKREFLSELEQVFDVEEITGIRNIPARSLAGGIRKLGFLSASDRFLDWMVSRGYRLDVAIEKTPLSALTGFFWLAKARRRA